MLPNPYINPVTNFSFETFRTFRAVGLSRIFMQQTLDVPQGNGNPVLCIPGFITPDASMKDLRVYLEQIGYNAYGWNNGFNWGPQSVPLVNVMERVRDISERNDGKPVDIIGQSLGGTYALGLASSLKDTGLVGRVITLGSPINERLIADGDDGINPIASVGFDMMNDKEHPDVTHFMETMADVIESGLPDTPVTSIYSLFDGVVNAELSQFEGDHPLKENIGVYFSSHTGMGFDPLIRFVIADRLSQEPGTLPEFNGKDYVPFPQFAYH